MIFRKWVVIVGILLLGSVVYFSVKSNIARPVIWNLKRELALIGSIGRNVTSKITGKAGSEPYTVSGSTASRRISERVDPIARQDQMQQTQQRIMKSYSDTQNTLRTVNEINRINQLNQELQKQAARNQNTNKGK